ncbi:hypothetical protein SI65_07780 [Aspergillus cristatus]|uniref:Uncharacterized protein n=1 Tax=Aspergillus cristatus TaxID=573508 RepID=A0A1E3B764_ASPCR|nr:hypothetical protein SI65_07780 [Aspergillus cristatus]
MPLEDGAGVNSNDADGWTPLHGACVKEHTGIVRLLLDKVDGGRGLLDLIPKQMESKKQRALLIKMAVEKGKESTVLTGLRFAAQEGQVGKLQIMLEKGAEIKGKDTAGHTDLELASFQGHETVVKLLLEHKADVNLRGSDGRPPLDYAIQQLNENVVSLLHDHGEDANASVYGQTLVMLASEIGNISITQRLITAGADINAQDYSGRTALHLAAMHGQEDIVRLLIENKLENLEGSGIDVEEAPIKGRYYILDCSSCTYQVKTFVSLEGLLRLTR